MTQEDKDEHRRRYPEQYSHPLCGARVRVRTEAGVQGEGVVERVVHSPRFGPLASVPSISETTFWRVQDCVRVEDGVGKGW